MIKAILFDFGGTIDTGGTHWFKKIQEVYKKFEISIDENVLREAYIYAERKLEKTKIPDNMSFKEIIGYKFAFQFQFIIENSNLNIENEYVALMTEYLYSEIKDEIEKNKEEIIALKDKYYIGIVSNFYGNLNYVLNEFGVLELCDLTIDSTNFGIRKPNENIWLHAIYKLNLDSDEVVIIGDSHKNDIAPAMKIGARSIWLKRELWNKEEETKESDMSVGSFPEIRNEIEKILEFSNIAED